MSVRCCVVTHPAVAWHSMRHAPMPAPSPGGMHPEPLKWIGKREPMDKGQKAKRHWKRGTEQEPWVSMHREHTEDTGETCFIFEIRIKNCQISPEQDRSKDRAKEWRKLKFQACRICRSAGCLFSGCCLGRRIVAVAGNDGEDRKLMTISQHVTYTITKTIDCGSGGK